MNLGAVETGCAHGMNAYSQLDAAVWRDYIDNLNALHAEAEAIRSRLRDGTIRPARTRHVVADVPIEEHNTETFMINPSAELRQAHRAEQKLVHRYRSHMCAKGITVVRRKYLPAGEVRPIFSDVWGEARNVLIEEKNSDSRDAMRQQ